MKLSIVIPCYNCKETIGRLLDSILDNELNKEEYEVIIVDDRSTDGFLGVVEQYKHLMRIVVTETTRNVHCPGNTRQAGLPLIQGEWFCFADNDDMFEPNAFKTVLDYLAQHPDTYTVATNFREWKNNSYIREYKGQETDTWLHGKFFNTQHTLREFGCHFEEDLISHEDVYFNTCNLVHLISKKLDYVYLPVFTYKWVYEEKSISRSFYLRDSFYIEQFMRDYIHSASYPLFSVMNESEDRDVQLWCLDQIVMTFLHCYFYIQKSIWKNGGADKTDTSLLALKQFKRKIRDEIGLEENGLINYVYQNPKRYDEIKKQCYLAEPFIETQSFRDFVINL